MNHLYALLVVLKALALLTALTFVLTLGGIALAALVERVTAKREPRVPKNLRMPGSAGNCAFVGTTTLWIVIVALLAIEVFGK